MKKLPGSLYTLAEEIANAVTHGLGAALAIAGTVVLIVVSAIAGDPWRVVSSSLYGASAFLLFMSSTMYHALIPERAKAVFRVFDHSTIFLLIAGTYTPLTLVTLRGGWGWALFGVEWGFAVAGIVLNAVNLERFKRFSMICYIAMGWCAVVAIFPLIMALGWSLLLLLLGGLFYTGGVLFYRRKDKKFTHSIWHVFVLLGALSHYFLILFFVIGG